MEFESSTSERVAAATAFGSLGFTAIGVAYVFPETSMLVFVMGLVLLGLGLAFGTWNTTIHVERRARRVTKIQRVLLWVTIQSYPFASFCSVKVALSAKTAVKMGTGTVYRLKLDGAPSLALPGNYDKRSADDDAVALSRLMDLRVEGRQGARRKRPTPRPRQRRRAP